MVVVVVGGLWTSAVVVVGGLWTSALVLALCRAVVVGGLWALAVGGLWALAVGTSSSEDTKTVTVPCSSSFLLVLLEEPLMLSLFFLGAMVDLVDFVDL